MASQDNDRPDAPDGSTSSRATLLLVTWNDGEAAMIGQLLENYGIPVQTVSDVPHSVYPITVDGLGEVRILVPENRLAEARALIEEHQRHGLGAGESDGEPRTPDGDEGDA